MTDFTKRRDGTHIHYRACKKSVLLAFLVPLLAVSALLNIAFYTGDVVSRTCAAGMIASSANVDYYQTEPVRLKR